MISYLRIRLSLKPVLFIVFIWLAFLSHDNMAYGAYTPGQGGHMHCPAGIPGENPAIAGGNVKLFEPHRIPAPFTFFFCDNYNNANGYNGACPNDLYIPRRNPVGKYELYHILQFGSPRIYNLSSSFRWGDRIDDLTSGTASCNVNLGCQNSCEPPQEVGSCDNQCDFSIVSNNQCGTWGQATVFDFVVPGGGGGDARVTWGDGEDDDVLFGEFEHTYINAGVYDVVMDCSCAKRINATCDQSGNLPTATPTPNGLPGDCPAGLTCMLPCLCNGGAFAGDASNCSGSGGLLNGGLGAGSNPGSCGPGLVCCAPPPPPATAWYKVKDASFHKRSDLVNAIPNVVDNFDNDDDGLCNNADPNSIWCFNINEPGVVTAQGDIDLINAPVSFRGWQRADADYTPRTFFDPATFLEYVRARKQYVNIDNLSEIESNAVNVIEGDAIFDDNFNNGIQGKAPFVLIIDGDLTINVNNKLNPSDRDIAIIVTGTTNIRSTLNEMVGIYLTGAVDFAYDIASGSTVNQTLKVTGNFASFTPAECTEKRARTSQTDKPTCFFVFDESPYTTLWSLLSTRAYEWKELAP